MYYSTSAAAAASPQRDAAVPSARSELVQASPPPWGPHPAALRGRHICWHDPGVTQPQPGVSPCGQGTQGSTHLLPLAYPSKAAMLFPNPLSSLLIKVLGRGGGGKYFQSSKQSIFIFWSKTAINSIYCLQEGSLQDTLPLRGLFKPSSAQKAE